jgi:hypothetical protein
MSRGYRVMMEPLQQAKATASGSDELCIQVSLLPVLGEDRMRELLQAALREDGWLGTNDGSLTKSLGQGLQATLSPDGRNVSVVQMSTVEVTGSARTGAEAARQAKENAARAESGVKRQATTTLAKAEGDVRAALDGVIQRVYVSALEEKARSMGELQSMERHEGSDGTVEVVLKVRV